VGGDEEGFLIEGVQGIGIADLSFFRFWGFDEIRSVFVRLFWIWLVGNLVWGLMVMSVLLFIR
jgi:hypothetical protein